jgi:hypothetical protein
LQVRFFLILLGKQLVIEHIFEYSGSMELGDSTTAERHQRSVVDEALDTFDAALTDLISTVETSGLETCTPISRSRCGNASNASATNSP